MDREFQQSKDWFDVDVVPGIFRRTIIGALLIGLCITAWLNWGSWVSLVLAAIVVAERAFEFAHIRKSKKIIGSMSIRASDSGLAFRAKGIDGSVDYPWPSLAYNVVKTSNGKPMAILIEDRSRKNSKLKLVGYEDMSDLAALIEGNAGKP